MKSQEKHYITRIYHKKKFCKSITFPGYIYIWLNVDAGIRSWKCHVPGPLCKPLKDVLLSVNVRELEVLSAKCRGGQRSPSLVRRRGGKSKIRFSQRKLFILLPISFNAILVQKVKNGKIWMQGVLHALCSADVSKLLSHFYDITLLIQWNFTCMIFWHCSYLVPIGHPLEWTFVVIFNALI